MTCTSTVYETRHPCGAPHTYSNVYLVVEAMACARPAIRGTPPTTESLNPLSVPRTTLLPRRSSPTPMVHAPAPFRFSVGGVYLICSPTFTEIRPTWPELKAGSPGLVSITGAASLSATLIVAAPWVGDTV